MTERASPVPARRKNKGRRVAVVAVLVAVLFALAAGAYWWHTRNQVSTDDAFVQADIVHIAPRVAGTVAQVLVRDNQHVDRGDPLFTLDPADYKAALAKAEANLRAARAAEQAAPRALAVTRQTSNAKIKHAKATLASARAEKKRTAANARRYRALYAKHETSRQQLDEATTSATAAAAKVRSAKARLAEAQTAPEKIALKQAQVASAQAKIAQAKAAVKQARLNLSYTKVRAPHAGQITKKSIVAGSHISAGQAALAVVENDPWVVANFKETQIARIKPGQPVAIAIDAFPGHTFSGRVQSIQAGTGAAFSLLPPENATGNYVKIVQRVPVKIIFDQPNQLKGVKLAPGMSTVPTIHLASPIKPLNRNAPPAAETAGAGSS